jgi:hypothetical protein
MTDITKKYNEKIEQIDNQLTEIPTKKAEQMRLVEEQFADVADELTAIKKMYENKIAMLNHKPE